MRSVVVGVGNMGGNHARVLSSLSELVGIQDINADMGKEIAARFSTEYLDSMDRVIDLEPDIAVVATPTETHWDVAGRLLENGINVLVEKPICSTVKEAEALISTANDSGAVLAVGQIERHNPVVTACFERLSRGEFGKIISLSSKRVSPYVKRIRDVGVILDIGIHDIDVMRYLVGAEPLSVTTRGDRSKREEFVHIVMDFPDGVTGVAEVNWRTPMKLRKLDLTCTDSYVDIDYIRQSLEVSTSSIEGVDIGNGYNIPISYETRILSVRKEEPLRRELSDFMEAVEKGRRPLVDGTEGMLTLKVAEAAKESLRRNTTVKLGDD